MLDIVANKITDKLSLNGFFAPEERDVCFFGLQQGLHFIFTTMLILIIGIVTRNLLFVTVFLIAYIPLRSFAGGYHAANRFNCNLASCFMVVAMIVVFETLFISNVLLFVLLLFFGVSIIVICPIGCKSKPLDKLEVKVYGKRTRIICTFEIYIAAVAILVDIPIVPLAIFLALVAVLILLILGRLVHGSNRI